MCGKLKSGNSKISRVRKDKNYSTNEMAPKGIAADEQQQNRVILYFANGQKIAAVPDGEAKVTPEQREKVLADLTSGKISREEIEGFLRNVTMPLTDDKESIDKVFTQIAQDLRQKQILAVLTGYNATDWQRVSRDDLRSLLGKPAKGQPNYRMPVGFAIFREKFLVGIEDKADTEQMQAYERAMDDLERKIYGRRFDYYQQIRLMKFGAENGTVDDMAQSIESAREINSVEPEGLKTETEMKAPVSGALDTVQGAEILSQAMIMGDPWKQDGNEYLLTTENLVNNGLMPIFAVEMSGQRVALTQPFQLSDGRGAALGFVPSVDGYKVRGFYLDQKTGLWNLVPDIIRGPRNEGMSQITEGYGEESVMLPMVLQENLTELVKTKGFREITTVNADFLLAGTAVAYDTMQEYREVLARGQMRSDFYREVDAQPVVLGASNGGTKAMPQLVSVNANVAPDFQKHVGGFVTYSVLAGTVQMNVFESLDGHVRWLFCNDEYGRSWIGGAEIDSPLTSMGCRANWAMAGDLMTPLYEYSTQASGYGDPNDVRKGMIGMWNRYLSKMPVIQEYVAWRSRGLSS